MFENQIIQKYSGYLIHVLIAKLVITDTSGQLYLREGSLRKSLY